MKRYLGIVLIVLAVVLSAGKGSWNISNNSLKVIITTTNK
ncbi:hypothetical protein ROSI111154_23385 [Rouxiella silvae]